MSESRAPAMGRVIAAFAAVYLLWGSTYLAIRFAIETLPPLLMAGVRFLLAGAVLYAFMRLRGEPAPTRRHWKSAALIGALLLVGGNGGVTLAERTVPSGVAALLVAMVPLWMVLLEWLRPGGTRPTGRVAVGLAVGFAGMVILVGPSQLAGAGAVDFGGAALVLCGSLAWSIGSIYARRATLPANAFVATGMEMLCGGVLLLVAGAARGELAGLDPAAFTGRSLAALAYLVVFGSLVGFTAYIWLLGVSTPARVSTYAYVNPVVAVFLGWAMAGEAVTARVLIAAAVIVAAVAVITTGPRPRAEPGALAGAAGPPGSKARSRRRRQAA
ncbi:drug/metabolite exporter YedA [Longimicrobium sp.]|uniref:drug/metabolite exporter YedA n=1 Tax=Longimicrobium sp. TaxID=2029185 RepID=UPI002EDB4472